MSSAASQPNLRLVGIERSSPEEQARLAIIKENRIAAYGHGIDADFARAIDAHDPRWVLAMQTQARLQGATLSPDRRDELLKKGKRLGLRPFESNLIIAIVQDRARAGVPAKDAGPMLTLVRPPSSSASPPARPVTWPQWVAAIAGALALAAVLMRWLAG